MNSVFHAGFIELVNQYISASVPKLYPLNKAENLKFSDAFWGYQIGTLGRNGLNTTLWKKLYFCMKGVSNNLLQFSWYNYMFKLK